MNDIVQSPQMPVDQGLVRTEKEFSDSLTGEMTDEEIARATKLLTSIKRSWQAKFQSKFRDINNMTDKSVEEALDLVEQFRDEITYRMATEVDVLVAVDVTPLYEGRGIAVDYLGKVGGDKGIDHDRKKFEVVGARNKGEDYYGQKENHGAAKRRDEKQRRKNKDLQQLQKGKDEK